MCENKRDKKMNFPFNIKKKFIDLRNKEFLADYL
jgi:hypothetical protein